MKVKVTTLPKMGIPELFPRFFHSSGKLVRTLMRVRDEKQSKHPHYLYVLGSGYRYSPKVVFVSALSSRFLFNCGPGTSRLLNEHRGKFRKLSAIFATRSSWDNYGGLPTVALKLNESRNKDVAVYGVPNLENMMTAGNGFLHMHHTKLKPSSGVYSGKNVEIVEVKLKRENWDILNHKVSKNSDPLLGEEPVTAYVMKIAPYKGRVLDVEKLINRGVLPTIHIANLIRGESVTLANGEIVHPDDLSNKVEPSLVIMVECPTKDYLRSLEESEKLKQSCIDSKECNTTVVHFSPSNVIRSNVYRNWMKKFSASTYHLIVNESNVADGLVVMRYRQLLLSRLHPGIFPPLEDAGYYWRHGKHYDSKPQQHLMCGATTPYIDLDNQDYEQETTTVEEPCQGSRHWLSQWKGMEGVKIYEGRSGTRIPFQPFTLERAYETVFEEYVYHLGYKNPLPKNIVANIRQKFLDVGVDVTKPLQLQAEYEKSYPRVIFLGTSSKTDTRERNVTGILLRISKESSVLFDCGEGTHSQIYRLFDKRAPQIFRSIRTIFISHLHGDHHLGLTSLLSERAKAFETERVSPVVLFAPKSIRPWLHFMDKFVPLNQQLIHVHLHTVLHDASDANKLLGLKHMDYVYSMTGLVKVQAARVPHCSESYGMAIQHVDGWKITYSGDTLFSNRLKEIGEGSDLLIHEATYDDNRVALAVRNRHSTVSQGVEAGRNMNAKFTILTHVSQRYSTLSSKDLGDSTDFSFAFDFMQVPLKYCHHLPILHELYSYLNEVEADDDLGSLTEDGIQRVLNV